MPDPAWESSTSPPVWWWAEDLKTQSLKRKFTFLWSIKYKALPDRKTPENGGSLICYHPGTCSSPDLDKVNSWLGLHPNHFKPNPQPQANSHSHLPKLGIRQYSQGTSSFSGAGITEPPTSQPDCCNARQGRKGLSSHLLPSTTGMWQWAFSMKQGGKGHPWAWQKLLQTMLNRGRKTSYSSWVFSSFATKCSNCYITYLKYFIKYIIYWNEIQRHKY